MKIIVAGKEQPELAEKIRTAADAMRHARRQPSEISPEIGALVLQNAGSDADYHRDFIRLLRYRDAVDTFDFEIPRRPGLFGAGMQYIKRVLWKLLRYQHDRITFRQNLINAMFTAALENELRLRERESEELRRRLDALEKKLAPAIFDNHEKTSP